MPNPKVSKNIGSAHVSFGSDISINTSKRLPKYDNGNSLAYRAYDTKNTKFIAIVSGVEDLPRWDAVDNYNALADTSFMRLISSGAVRWPIDGNQKFVFIYSDNMGKALLGHDGVHDVGWRHPDIIEFFIHPMARMFKEMDSKNFNHGSVRLSNIYLSVSGKGDPIVLGDALSVYPGSTQSSVYFSPSKALADPFGRGSGALADDIYAFGVCLVLFLRKTGHITELSEEELINKKIEIGSYAALIGSGRFQVSFLELLKGILHDDANLRWGVDEIFSWLDGTRLAPGPLIKKKKATRPITFMGKKYLYAEYLAMDIHKSPSEAADMFENGVLGLWIVKSIDESGLTERYEKVLDRNGGLGAPVSDKDLLVSQLGLVLNTMLPVRYKDKSFTYDGLGAMLARGIISEDNLSYYSDVLNLGLLDQASAGLDLPQIEVVENLKLYDACRASIKRSKGGYGIGRCAYLLCGSAPCLSPKLKGYFVSGHRSCLVSLEHICKQGKQISLFIDNHLIAFFSVRDLNLIDNILYDLNSTNKNQQILGNIRFAAAMQKKSKIPSVPLIAGIFLDSLSDVYKVYRNSDTRKKIKDGVRVAAEAGDLVGMVDLIGDEALLSVDDKCFKAASFEYKMLHNEYTRYNKRLANKKTYGVVEGRNVAAVVSWIGAIAITMIITASFLSERISF